DRSQRAQFGLLGDNPRRLANDGQQMRLGAYRMWHDFHLTTMVSLPKDENAQHLKPFKLFSKTGRKSGASTRPWGAIPYTIWTHYGRGSRHEAALFHIVYHVAVYFQIDLHLDPGMHRLQQAP